MEFLQGDIFEIMSPNRPQWVPTHEIDEGDVSFRPVDRLDDLARKVTADTDKDDTIYVDFRRFLKTEFKAGYVTTQNLRDEIKANGWSKLETACFIVPASALEEFENKFGALVIRLYEAQQGTDPWGVARRSPTKFRVTRAGQVVWSTASSAPRDPSVSDERKVSGGLIVAGR